jgi:hypothetical protein
VASLLGAAGGSTTVSAAALSTPPGRRLPSSHPAAAPLVVVLPGWDQADKAARVIHGGAALWVGKNAGVGTLRAAIGRVVDVNGYRAGARRMAAALAAGRRAGLIAGEPGAPANGGVCSPGGDGVAPWDPRLQLPIVE